MGNPTPASDAAGEHGPRQTLQPLAQPAYRRRRPIRVDDGVAAVAGGGGVIVVGVAAAVVDDDGEMDDDRGSLSGDGSHAFHSEDHAFHASHGSPESRNLANESAVIADDAVANEVDGGDAVEAATAKDPSPRLVRRHYSATDGLGLNGKPPLDSHKEQRLLFSWNFVRINVG